ncbi:hypothetical protein H6F67_00810 [Microcoleus sp. FACHB-1515]|uniref:NAD(P)-dependent oxidoreductase n=1 Tax=Cyanophyceae TaxID=3028117 RepID=UPI0016850356|nr:2-hydroxyacid dehydrogenase [Microcoleus sp. FACHB-1515]MBD2088413.1 hypothetical protein [Microcoleus sp. FACHB-1515]
MKIVLPDQIDIPDSDRTALKELGEVEIYDDICVDEAVILDRIRDAEIITAGWFQVSRSLMHHVPNLKYIVVPGVGYNNVDIEAASAANIIVCNCPQHNLNAVAEYTIALIFAVTRQIVAANFALRNNQWNPGDHKGIELRGKKLGLVGHGGIGSRVAKLAQAIGMQVEFVNSRSSAPEIDRLIATCDILSLHLPATAQSRHLIDERRLNLMKPTAYLINTARGAIVDQAALLKLLQQKRITGAALDVFENEPIAGTPNAEIQALVQLENVVATPHNAYNSEETAANLGEELLSVVRACISGSPINVVN